LLKRDPIFSFYLPAFKKSDVVFRKCLKSLFDMSLKEIEIIVVFDGPDQALESVAKEFSVQTFVIEHGGASKARNVGLSKCSGKYVVAWDIDCIAKPEMAARWLQEFEAQPDIDFVYTGYEIAGERGGFDSEPFNGYSLTCGNYISSMSPIKREKAPVWDESLQAGQDWDYWLSAVENGSKGAWIEGAGFITDVSDKGISSDHWNTQKREETIRLIREKHGITGRDIGIYSLNYGPRALKLAQLLGGDVIKPTGPSPTAYKMILNLGYGPLSRFEGIADDVTKVQFWVPGEIQALADAKYSTVMETIRIAKGVTNLCNTPYEQNRLSELGVSAEVVALALLEEDLAKAQDRLPDDFAILVVCDEAYAKLLKDMPDDLPHIKFGFNTGRIQDYSCLMSFYSFAAVDEAVLIAQVNGRNVISNIQAPFCGYIDTDANWEDFKKELYQKIREVRGKPFNKEAQAYYRQIVQPDAFKTRILSFMKSTQFEVIS
jgi:hypothetical protein